MQLLYAGSVKNLYADADPERVCFEYTDDYSVFDWGKMPDTISGKGRALAELGEFFFDRLTDAEEWKRLGLASEPTVQPWLPVRHHFLRREANRLFMQRVAIPPITPAKVGGTLVYDYAYPRAARQLIPLEVIFRFGVPHGSSLLERAHWYPFEIKEGIEFADPLIEFSTKLESKDRNLTYQEAAMVLGGDTKQLTELMGRTAAVALFLRSLFAERGLKLWDGKLEWAHLDGGLCLVDSIGPDELRVSLGDATFSKQFLRDFYLGSPWHKAIYKAHEQAKQRGTSDWKSIVRDEMALTPHPLSAPYAAAAHALYDDFHAIMVKGESRTLFSEIVTALP